jgi:hypothetical protein
LKWIRHEAATLPEPGVSGSIREMEFDEMWHFIGSKKTKDGPSRRWSCYRPNCRLGYRQP